MSDRDWPECVKRVTRAVRKADAEFESAGGTSRHWVRDHFLPALQAEGVVVSLATAEPSAEPADWPRYFLASMQEDFAAEIERRRRGPGGQQVGPGEYSGIPMSVLKRLERDCRHMLERTSSVAAELAKWPDSPVPAMYKPLAEPEPVCGDNREQCHHGWTSGCPLGCHGDQPSAEPCASCGGMCPGGDCAEAAAVCASADVVQAVRLAADALLAAVRTAESDLWEDGDLVHMAQLAKRLRTATLRTESEVRADERERCARLLYDSDALLCAEAIRAMGDDDE